MSIALQDTFVRLYLVPKIVSFKYKIKIQSKLKFISIFRSAMASLDYVKNTNLKQEQTIIKKIAKYQKFRFSIFSLPRGKSRTK